MKVLHLVAGDLAGGAARGAYWLHQAQREIGVDSTLITSGRNTDEDTSLVSLSKTTQQRAMFALLLRLGNIPLKLYKKRTPWIFNTGFTGIDFTKHPLYKDADIVHLHWINGLVAMHTLRKVRKPIVWTLRDMWPLTGGCHYSMNCERYKFGCGRCPQLGSSSDRDLSRLVVALKRASLPRHMQLVGISSWLSDCAGCSKVFEGFSIHTISNNIDTQLFYPVEPNTAREILGLPLGKRLVLVGAQSVSDFYKGFDLFKSALKELKRDDLHIVFLGRTKPRDSELFCYQSTSLGFLSDIVSLRLAYSAADVFVAPSRMEAFGKTLAEAMSCSTPVVCFDATGPKDIVVHQVTGYKAKPFEPRDLARGINWVLDQTKEQHDRLRMNAREQAVKQFDSRVIACQYTTLYEQMLEHRVTS